MGKKIVRPSQDLNHDRLTLQGVLKKISQAWIPLDWESAFDADLSYADCRDVNERNVELETPLMIAARSLGPEEVQVLVENGADINAQSGSEWQMTALQFAQMWGKKDVVDKLLELGADPTIRDKRGLTAEPMSLEAASLLPIQQRRL